MLPPVPLFVKCPLFLEVFTCAGIDFNHINPAQVMRLKTEDFSVRVAFPAVRLRVPNIDTPVSGLVFYDLFDCLFHGSPYRMIVAGGVMPSESSRIPDSSVRAQVVNRTSSQRSMSKWT